MTDHAAHYLPRCLTCGHDLSYDDQQTCAHCVDRTRRQLADIPRLHARLPGLLIENRIPATGRDPIRGSSEHAMPGGDALTMLAAGNTGTVTASARGNRDHAVDNHRDDPPSVLAILDSWVRDWCDTFRHHNPPHTTVEHAGGYLLTHLAWAAREHPAFDEFAYDIRDLHGRLMNVTGLADRPETAPVSCFDCGGRLERHYLEHVGRQDDWRCRACGRIYTPAAYTLAVRARLENDPDVIVTAEQLAARHPGLTAATVRQWATRGRLTRRGRDENGRTLYRAGDVTDLLTDTPDNEDACQPDQAVSQ